MPTLPRSLLVLERFGRLSKFHHYDVRIRRVWMVTETDNGPQGHGNLLISSINSLTLIRLTFIVVVLLSYNPQMFSIPSTLVDYLQVLS